MNLVMDAVCALEQLSWALLQREDAPEPVLRAFRELRNSLEEWLGGVRDDNDNAPGGALHVPAHGDWIRLPTGAHVDLRNRRAVRRLAHGLLAARIARPGVPLAASELIAMTWPSADPADPLVMKRLHVTLSRLRRAGFEHVLVTRSEANAEGKTGWLVNPVLAIVRGSTQIPRVAA